MVQYWCAGQTWYGEAGAGEERPAGEDARLRNTGAGAGAGPPHSGWEFWRDGWKADTQILPH